jgi:hypothetical protein
VPDCTLAKSLVFCPLPLLAPSDPRYSYSFRSPHRQTERFVFEDAHLSHACPAMSAVAGKQAHFCVISRIAHPPPSFLWGGGAPFLPCFHSMLGQH